MRNTINYKLKMVNFNVVIFSFQYVIIELLRNLQ